MYLTIAALVSWKLALFTIAVSAVMLGSLNRFLLSAKRSAKTQQKLLRSILGRLTDVLIGIKPMKAMGRQARFAQLFDRDLRDVRKAARRQVFSRNVNKALQDSCAPTNGVTNSVTNSVTNTEALPDMARGGLAPIELFGITIETRLDFT